MVIVKAQKFFDLEASFRYLLYSLTKVIRYGAQDAIPSVELGFEQFNRQLSRFLRGKEFRHYNKLLNSFAIRGGIIKACTEELFDPGGVAEGEEGNLQLLEQAFEDTTINVDTCLQETRKLAKSGHYPEIVSLLEKIGEWFYLDQSRPISDPVTYCFIYERPIRKHKKHHKLLCNIISNLGELEITPAIIPKSPRHIFREVRHTWRKGDMDIVIQSELGRWYAIQAKSFFENKTQEDARRQLRQDYHCFGEKLGIDLTLIEVYGAKNQKFDSFVYNYP